MATTFRFEDWTGKILNTLHFQAGQKVRIAGHTDPVIWGSLVGGHVLISLIAPNNEIPQVNYQAGIDLLGNWYYDLTLPNTNADVIVHVGNGPDIFNVTIDVSQTITIGTGSSGTIDPGDGGEDGATSGGSMGTWVILGLIAIAVVVVIALLVRSKGASVSLGSKSLKVGGKA